MFKICNDYRTKTWLSCMFDSNPGQDEINKYKKKIASFYSRLSRQFRCTWLNQQRRFQKHIISNNSITICVGLRCKLFGLNCIKPDKSSEPFHSQFAFLFISHLGRLSHDFWVIFHLRVKISTALLVIWQISYVIFSIEISFDRMHEWKEHQRTLFFPTDHRNRFWKLKIDLTILYIHHKTQ